MRRKSIFVLLLATSVVACQLTGYRTVGRQPADTSYSVTSFGMRVSGDTRGICTATVHTKIFNDTGKLGICGFILHVGETGCLDGLSSQEFIDEVFERATLMLDEEEISKAGCYTQRDIGTTATGADATCVRIDKTWQESYANANVKFKFDAYNLYEFN